MRPGEGVVEDVDAGRFGLFGLDGLQVRRVGREVAAFDGVVHVFDVVVRGRAGELFGFVWMQGFDASVGRDVPFDVDEGAVLLAELVGVHAKGIDVTELRETRCSVLEHES